MHQIFTLLLLLHSPYTAQRTDPLSTEDQVCITSSNLSNLFAGVGTYIYRAFDTKSRGPIYHNSEQNYYLYPWTYSATNTDYLISQSPAQSTANTYCNLPVAQNDAVINPDDCFNSWLSTTQNTPNPDIISVNCNDICVSGSSHSLLNAAYKWIHFNSTTQSSVYFYQDSIRNYYLFGQVFIDVNDTIHHNWRIGPHYSQPAAWSSCNINTTDTNYVFDLNDCIIWSDAIDSKWINDQDIIVQKCTTNQDNAPAANVTVAPNTATPTLLPSVSTHIPTVNPIISPTISTHNPSVNPTVSPTLKPSVFPTITPTQNPTNVPTNFPTKTPSFKPTDSPSSIPTNNPTKHPSLQPSMHPSITPTNNPITPPTRIPSASSQHPTYSPSTAPSHMPSISTVNPSMYPITSNPTMYPTIYPITSYPTIYPIASNPSMYPITFNPTIYPTHATIGSDSGDHTHTVSPSTQPTDIMTTHIIISTHPDISDEWIAFSLSNINLSCGGYIQFVAITDSNINNEDWMTTSSKNEHGWYEFSGFESAQILPISIQITKHSHHELQSIKRENIIHSWRGGMMYDFGDNFCTFSESAGSNPMTTDPIDNAFYYLVIVICFIFIMFGIVAIFEARCCHKNDYFEALRVISAVISILAMMSYIFFINEVWLHLHFNAHLQLTFLAIFTLSVTCLIVPMLASIYILYYESTSKYWLFNDRIRHWKVKYTELLYFYSVITGSSFTAIDIFNSNSFGLDLFSMGIPHQKLLPFIIKKVYSMILFSHFPQFTLSFLHCALLSKLHFIPFVSMIFSSLSIIVTIINIIIQKEIIYKTNDYLYITVEVQGKVKSGHKSQYYCKNKIKHIKAYLCESVFGINAKFVQIMRPYDHDTISKGLQLQIHITYTHDNDSNDPSDKYEDALNNAIDNGPLRQIIKNEWKLLFLPQMKNISCQFVKSSATRNKLAREKIQTDDDYSVDGSESNDTIMDRWVQCTEIEERNESESLKPAN